MPVISRKDLVAKNKDGRVLRSNDVGNNRRNNAAMKALDERRRVFGIS